MPIYVQEVPRVTMNKESLFIYNALKAAVERATRDLGDGGFGPLFPPRIVSGENIITALEAVLALHE